MFVAESSADRNGWCVFRLIDDLTMSYHAGPFSEKAAAESEARRLNDMTMNTVYLAIKHPQHPYSRGAHLEAGTLEEAFDNRKAAADFVAEKNKKATYNFWSVKAKKVKVGAGKTAPKATRASSELLKAAQAVVDRFYASKCDELDRLRKALA